MCHDGVWVVLFDTSFPFSNVMQYDFQIALFMTRSIVIKLRKRVVTTTASSTIYSLIQRHAMRNYISGLDFITPSAYHSNPSARGSVFSLLSNAGLNGPISPPCTGLIRLFL